MLNLLLPLSSVCSVHVSIVIYIRKLFIDLYKMC